MANHFPLIIPLSTCLGCSCSRLERLGQHPPDLTTLLVCSDRVDEPVRFGECLGLVHDILFAGACLGRACVIVAPYVAGPVAAHCQVNHDDVVFEVFVNVAAFAANKLS